jgi:hypothetical protein
MTNKEVQNITLESLRDWFKKEKWVRISTSGDIVGPCGTSKNKKNPDRCLPKAKAQSLTKGQRAATAAKKKKAGAKGKTVVKNTKKATVKKEEYKGKHQGTNYKWPMSQATKDRKEADKKSSHKNSNAHKDAVAAGNAMKKEATFDDIKNLSYDSVKKTFGIRKKISQAILNFFPHEDHMVKVEYHGDYIEDEDELTVKQLLNYVDKRLDDNVINKDDIDVTPAKGNAPTLFIDAGENSFEITSLDDEEFFAETANPQDGKAAPFGSGYKKVKEIKVTKEDIRNLAVGLLHEIQNTNFKVLKKGPYYRYLPTDDLFTDLNQLGHHGLQRSPDNLVVIKTAEELLNIFDDMYYDDPERALAWADQNDDIIKFIGTNEVLMEKDDRCTRIAKRKYDTWPSAYASGAVVRCRRGEIWKKK